MGTVMLDMAMSLDGYIAGPDDVDGGLHDWFFHPSDRSAAVIAESLQMTGALLMGHRTYAIGAAADGFADTPYRVPHVVLCHRVPPQPAAGATRFLFVTDGVEQALAVARAAANGKTVVIAGGATTARQYLQAGLVDTVQIHLVPVLLGAGIRLFDHPDRAPEPLRLESKRVIESDQVTHLLYRVVT